MSRASRLWFVACLVVLASAAPTVAQAAETDANVEEFVYSGDGDVSISGDELHVWQSGSHAFTVTISSDSGVDGRLCLVAESSDGDAERELACRQLTVRANATDSVTVGVDGWPDDLTGEQEVRSVVKTSNASVATGNTSLSLTVIRKDADPDGDGLQNQREASLGTDLWTADTDGDGFTDGEEVKTYETDPTDNDTDGDGLSDHEEIEVHQTNPKAADSDGDGLSDQQELAEGTKPNKADTDGDGLEDGLEVNTYETDPTNPDTDGDGLDDGAEVETHKTNPLQPDTDSDGLDDNLEINTYGTDPNKVDTDGDGLEDGVEVNRYQTDPTKVDSDGDGLPDGQEVNTYGTNPTNPDTDGDGLEDGAEVNKYETNPNEADTDGDGTSDRAEVTNSEVPAVSVPVAALVVAVIAAGAGGLILYRSGAIDRADLSRARAAVGQYVPRSDGTAEPSAGVEDQSLEEVPPEFLSNDERVLGLLDEHEGQMRQSEIVEETEWSKSKVSRVLAEMAEEGKIVKIEVGRGNIVTRPENLPPGAQPPFND